MVTLVQLLLAAWATGVRNPWHYEKDMNINNSIQESPSTWNSGDRRKIMMRRMRKLVLMQRLYIYFVSWHTGEGLLRSQVEYWRKITNRCWFSIWKERRKGLANYLEITSGQMRVGKEGNQRWKCIARYMLINWIMCSLLPRGRKLVELRRRCMREKGWCCMKGVCGKVDRDLKLSHPSYCVFHLILHSLFHCNLAVFSLTVERSLEWPSVSSPSSGARKRSNYNRRVSVRQSERP